MSNTEKQLERAKEIVDRYHARGGVIPREQRDRSNPTKLQEYRDACKLKAWKYSLLGKNKYVCSDEVKTYLDQNMPEWRSRVYGHQGINSSIQMKRAREIVQRYRERGYVRPQRTSDPSRSQEYKDAEYLGTWKSSLKGNNRVTCSTELRDYLDENMPGWRDDHRRRRRASDSLTTSASTSSTKSKTSQSMATQSMATEDVISPFDDNNTSGLEINSKKRARDVPVSATANNVETGIRGETAAQRRRLALYNLFMKAQEIVRRCNDRGGNVEYALPRHIEGYPTSPDLILEQVDAMELAKWKQACLAFGEGADDCDEGIPWELKVYLDRNLPGWLDKERKTIESTPHHMMTQAASNCTNTKKSADIVVDHANVSLYQCDNSNANGNLDNAKEIHSELGNCGHSDIKFSTCSSSAGVNKNGTVATSDTEAKGVAALLQLSYPYPSVENNHESVTTMSSSCGSSATMSVDCSGSYSAKFDTRQHMITKTANCIMDSRNQDGFIATRASNRK